MPWEKGVGLRAIKPFTPTAVQGLRPDCSGQFCSLKLSGCSSNLPQVSSGKLMLETGDHCCSQSRMSRTDECPHPQANHRDYTNLLLASGSAERPKAEYPQRWPGAAVVLVQSALNRGVDVGSLPGSPTDLLADLGHVASLLHASVSPFCKMGQVISGTSFRRGFEIYQGRALCQNWARLLLSTLAGWGSLHCPAPAADKLPCKAERL